MAAQATLAPREEEEEEEGLFWRAYFVNTAVGKEERAREEGSKQELWVGIERHGSDLSSHR